MTCGLAIIWTNARILLVGPSGTNCSEIVIEIHTFNINKMHWKCRLGHIDHFVSASMCKWLVVYPTPRHYLRQSWHVSWSISIIYHSKDTHFHSWGGSGSRRMCNFQFYVRNFQFYVPAKRPMPDTHRVHLATHVRQHYKCEMWYTEHE